jgi:hypothetical protein
MKKLPHLLAGMALAAIMDVNAECPVAPAPVATSPPTKVTADQALSTEWTAMAEAGDPLAQALLARAYLVGTDGMVANPQTAGAWARRSAGQRHPLGLFLWGWCMRHDHSEREAAAKPFFSQALAAGFKSGAGSGGRQWLATLGDAYAYGFGVPDDSEEAVKWYRKAADMGDAYAMYRLGIAYDCGNGFPEDREAALQWFRKSAALGETAAMVSIAQCYSGGIAVAKDATVAVEWYRKAADRRCLLAMYFLGCCYLNGSGVPKDEPGGVKWLLEAAAAGFTPAMRTLGDCCKNGRGVPVDKGQAAKWYRKAAALGDGLSEDHLKELDAAK